MKENLESALREELALVKQKEKKDNLYPLSMELLKDEDTAKLTKYYVE